MQRYELVVLIDSKLNKEDIAQTTEAVEKMLGTGMKQKDDIGFLDLATELNGNKRAYFVSYEVEIEIDTLNEMTAELRLMKSVVRYFFYKMGHNEKFFKFAEINKKFEVSEDEAKKQKDLQAFKEMDAITKRK